MQTLLVNLTRFGDLIQTRPVLGGLKEQGANPVLVCLDRFAPAAGLLGDTEAAPFPGDQVLEALNRDWVQALGLVHGWARSLAKVTERSVLNLTPAVSARLLARLMAFSCTADLAVSSSIHDQAAPNPAQAGPAVAGFSLNPAVAGFSVDANGFGASDSPWASFLLFSSNQRGCSPFNLADLLWKAARLPDTERPMGLPRPDDLAMRGAKELIEAAAGESAAQAEGYAALQLGASDNRRRWPVHSFAELGRRLWSERRLMPLLLGSAGESALAARYLESGAPGADLTGKTDLRQLAAVLCHARLLVTNDTGTMHLAAGLGTDVIALFLATAQPWDTGPYAPGALCLEPDLPCHPCGFDASCPHDHACRRAIPPATVMNLCAARLDRTGDLDGIGLDLAGARVWETAAGKDHFLDLRAVSNHERTDRTQWLRLQRGLYRQFLDSQPLPGPDSGLGAGLSDQARAEAVMVLERASALLALLAQQIALLSRDPRQTVKNSFLAAWRRVGDLWRDSTLFNVLGLMWSAQSQECGQDMASIAGHVARYAALAKAWRSCLGP